MTVDVQAAAQVLRPYWRDFVSAPERLPLHLQTVMLAWSYAGKVANAGHASWVEADGDRGHAVVQAIENLGLDDIARVAADALALFPNAAAAPPYERLAALVDTDALDEVDEQAYALGVPDVVWQRCSERLIASQP